MKYNHDHISQSLHFQIKEIDNKSRSFSLLKNKKKEYESNHTRRKSCLCSECGCLGRFQFENMNVEHIKKTKIMRNNSIQIDNNTITLPKHEVYFQRKKILHKQVKKSTIHDTNITGEKNEEQKNYISTHNSTTKIKLLSNILMKRESSLKFTNKIPKPKNLLDEIKQKFHQPNLTIKLSNIRIKTENLSYYHQQISPSQSKNNNYKNSPYYYTYRQVLTPKIKVREQIKIKQLVHFESMIKI